MHLSLLTTATAAGTHSPSVHWQSDVPWTSRSSDFTLSAVSMNTNQQTNRKTLLTSYQNMLSSHEVSSATDYRTAM